MFRPYLLALAGAIICCIGLNAQVTSVPSPLQENSTGVEIYFHADQGTRGLANQPASAQIYAHTGVITNTSASGSDWQYAPVWLDNNPKYKLEYVEPNLWRLRIGDIRTYYGITDPSVVVRKLAFVFRNADGSLEGKGDNGSDIFLNVYQEGLHLELAASPDVEVVSSETGPVSFSVTSTRPGDISISVNGQTLTSAAGVSTLQAEYTFAQTGDYTVSATVTSDGETASATRDFCYAPLSEKIELAGAPAMGALRRADGSATFCLAAPQKTQVILVGAWNDYKISSSQVMKYADVDGQRYFTAEISGLDPSKDYPYYYYVDGTVRVADPYARLVLDPAFDKYIAPDAFPSLPEHPGGRLADVCMAVLQRTDLPAYDWKVTDFKGVDKSQLLIYELLLRDFSGTEGEARGDGTVRGTIKMFPYLKSLGINAVELLPINEFNGNISWGYNPNFYFAPDKAYGTPDDYKEFIDLCHSEGIAVILDVVFNQADWQHPWYRMYPSGSNPFFNAAAPHAYSVLNDWNQDNPLVQQQWHDMLRYWLTEYKVDGFRFDLVKGLGDNSSYANSGDQATNAYNASRIARMRELQKVVESVRPDAYFINENLATAREENEMAAFGQLNWANVNDAGCQYAMGYQSGSGLSRMYAPADARTWGSTVSYLESHDEQRLAYKQDRWGVAGVKGDLRASLHRLGSCAAQMILAPGAHLIWQFSEMGNAQNTKNDDGGNNTDPKIVSWSMLDDPDRGGLVRTYRNLMLLRKRNPSLFAETATFSANTGADAWSGGRIMRSSDASGEIITLLNPNTSGAPLEMSFRSGNTDTSGYSVLFSSYDTYPEFDAAAGTVKVPANCFVVIGSGGVAGIDDVTGDDTDADAPVRYFDLQGRELSGPARGVPYIRLQGGKATKHINR